MTTQATSSSSLMEKGETYFHTFDSVPNNIGRSLELVKNALWGTTTRLARDRLHWMFSPNKDPRVSSLLDWIQTMSYGLGAYGLQQFLSNRERGALFTNVEFRTKEHPMKPAFDYLTFDEIQVRPEWCW